MKKFVGVILLIVSFAMIGYGSYMLFANKEYTVKYIDTGSSKINDSIVNKGSYLKKPNDPVKEGYKFLGWYLDGNLYNFNTKIEKDITLMAKWKKIEDIDVGTKKITVVFQEEDETVISKIELDKADVVSKPSDPAKDGYRFLGWYKGDKEFDFNKEISEDTTLVATWKKIYTVTFNSDGGSAVKEKIVDDGLAITKPADPVKSGYKFVEWQLNGKKYDFTTKVTSDITLKAVWSKVVEKYTVAFDSNGGTKVSSVTVSSGSVVKKPVNNPTKSGFVFVEWQLNGKTYNFSSKVSSNITLKAVWTASQSYTVTFNMDGGSGVSNVTLNGGKKVLKPSDPVKPGFVFVEWRLNGHLYDFNTPVNSNIVLDAIWEEEK